MPDYTPTSPTPPAIYRYCDVNPRNARSMAQDAQPVSNQSLSQLLDTVEGTLDTIAATSDAMAAVKVWPVQFKRYPT